MNSILVSDDKKKLILDDKYIFKDSSNYFLEVDNIQKDIFLVVSENASVVLNLLGKNTKFNIHLEIQKNANFTFNYLLIEGRMDIKVDLIGEEASFKLNYSVLNSNNSSNIIVVNHIASKTKSILKNHGFSKDHANLIFDVSAYINKEASKCTSRQDNKIIEDSNSLSQINPNLYIDNYDVEASHSAYVGEFKENELFYLMSRGLDLEMSKFLLLKAFLIGVFDLEESIQEKYYREVIKYFGKEV